MTLDAAEWLDSATIDPAVLALRPDYRALLLTAEGLRPGPSDDFSEGMLAAAESTARELLGDGAVEEHPHIAAWREAFRAFGAKPQRTRPSAEALLRRVAAGLPRVDRLTDIYNAISVAHVLPLGGEDLDHYAGPARLVRAEGDETFETTAGGEAVVEHPAPGEVVWRDDAGVTCRRWNWRQCTRTRLTHATTRAMFVLDALGPMDDAALTAAGDALAAALTECSPGVRIHSRLVTGARQTVTG
ncbi:MULTISPECIES: phenylalanine--tRNA ligase beta subunit-related protein [Streptomyces]|uniref:Phenylalanine--tRNA ligase beta subunit-related protein n=1 Tax=Streptomyces lonegramiae TaxID=3075524 RepID=A0ABU2XEL1_9ACTN|nr:phenylalanine--tRNA ligase beta subunit-related protein [Streptomyces sp. DSM 41529]MDT0543842.1 phenylalanine--tRNA ligase beta subunit-related protein [Streptomyces sp. DSM 41529]